MTRIFRFLKDPRTVSVCGLLLLVAATWLAGEVFEIREIWIAAASAGWIVLWLVYRLVRWTMSRNASIAMDTVFHEQAAEAVRHAPTHQKGDVELLRQRMLDAVHTIKTSKLGQTTGRAALYEMPWYIVIGNPAAGKSTAIVNSGLNFPFSEKTGHAIQGIGGTRNCDWFFTTEGILLDTAGRYAIQEEDRSEWFGFLGLLKKYRPKAPINGILIVASIAELAANRPDATITLAKQLRQRVQELTEQLELFAPVYVVFTKVDLVAGFADFFEDSDEEERSRVWGATLPYDTAGLSNATVLFDQHFDQLAEGLGELAKAKMALHHGQPPSPGTLTFPLEFQGVRQHLKTFVATLFEDNPFQFKPVFRGFYFTSAIQEGVGTPTASQRLSRQFGLSVGRRLAANISSGAGFFLKNLFSSVIFADRNLVRQYASRRKILLRQAASFGGALALGLLIAAWGWSFTANRQFLSNIQADLDKAAKIQETKIDLASRLEALELLQDRLEQLERYRSRRPISLSFGLYQGERFEHKLRSEYFRGLQQVMLAPVTAGLESFLSEVVAGSIGSNTGAMPAVANPAAGHAVSAASIEAGSGKGFSPYKDVSPSNPEDAYNALKAYLMLANRDRIESAHLGDQITRFWRNWLDANRGNVSRDQIIRSAEKLLSFYLSQAAAPDFPLIDNKLALVDQSRDMLRSLVKGTPARMRVYGEIKMRAATRFSAVTMAAIVGDDHKDLLTGSHAISGAFTRDAWEQYVREAIRDASTKELRSEDWVLKTAARDDLSLEGSPEQIQRELTRMYKAEYVVEWNKFIQTVAISDFTSFERAVQHMNRLGDPVVSPLNTLLQTLHKQTSWDNPSIVNQGLQTAKHGIGVWFRTTILRQAPTQINIKPDPAVAKNPEPQSGAIGKEFAAIARLMSVRNDNGDASLMSGYLAQLSRLRTRFNQIRNSGDVGPASKQFMQATLEGGGSELADALKYVDESMLTGMTDAERRIIRPMLVRPLMQAFAVIVAPTELELNHTWTAQVYGPFNRSLGTKYPFSPDSRLEATAGEIAQTFGPDGSIAKFVQAAMGPLVVRRGDTITARTWANMGIRFNPAFTVNVARYIAGPGINPAGESTGAGSATTYFQLQPIPAPAYTEFTVEIDGQAMRYRNGPQEWFNFAWPSPLGQPGARITAVTGDGRSVDIANFPGQFGLEKLINAAERRKLDNGAFAMTWASGSHAVSLNFKLISDTRTTQAGNNAQSGNGLHGLKLPATVAGGDTQPNASPL
ncbi:type VI secretion system membrane subunit TssM [Noviherbaspirillum saxi]|uniref:Type VI secretion system membrane subunit TssM n=1 Tax=Noviherbaspirillum saxi TaxID=2320863 RepID=A0A3A3FJZ9_9BURK|nr:type VI secretion system membrane subunit TssM [Noviherbaspirillum saxi]RJF95848.1 type VI secretion system membrane subunit TssM [Noviherbaspirillum saxi]